MRDTGKKLPEGWRWACLQDVIELQRGNKITKKADAGTKYPVFGGGGPSYYTDQHNREDDYVIARSAISPKCVRYVRGKFFLSPFALTFSVINPSNDYKPYIGYFLLSIQDEIYANSRGQGRLHLDIDAFLRIKIPLPSLSAQKRAVAQLDEQLVAAEHARKAIEQLLYEANLLHAALLRASIPPPPRWRWTQLSEVIVTMKDGGTPPRRNSENFGGDINWAVVKDIAPEIFSTKETLTQKGLNNSSARVWPVDSVIISLGATIGKVGIAKVPLATKQGLSGIIVNSEKILSKFLYYLLVNERETIQSYATGTTIKEVRPSRLMSSLNIPLPPLPEQKCIVAKLDNQFAAVERATQEIGQQLLEFNLLPNALLRESLLP